MSSDPFDLSGFEPEAAALPPEADRGAALPAPDWLARLNEAQGEAAAHLDGPLLVLAGAGTGKTRVLVSRLANILYRRPAWPSQRSEERRVGQEGVSTCSFWWAPLL